MGGGSPSVRVGPPESGGPLRLARSPSSGLAVPGGHGPGPGDRHGDTKPLFKFSNGDLRIVTVNRDLPGSESGGAEAPGFKASHCQAGRALMPVGGLDRGGRASGSESESVATGRRGSRLGLCQ
jgi:hypothetical protein